MVNDGSTERPATATAGTKIPAVSPAASSFYYLTGVVTAGLGLYMAWSALPEAGQDAVTYATAEGISAFAVLYIIAQASERIVEVVTGIVGYVIGKASRDKAPELVKAKAKQTLRVLNSTTIGNPTIAELIGSRAPAEAIQQATTAQAQTKTEAESAEEKLQEAVGPIRAFGLGVSILVCAAAVTTLDYSLLRHVGVTNTAPWADQILTTLAAAGGTKALHDLIGRFEASKQAKETGATT